MKAVAGITILMLLASCSNTVLLEPCSNYPGDVYDGNVIHAICQTTDLLIDIFGADLVQGDEISIVATVNTTQLFTSIIVNENTTLGELGIAIETLLKTEDLTVRVSLNDDGRYELYSGVSTITGLSVYVDGAHLFNHKIWPDLSATPDSYVDMSFPILMYPKLETQLKHIIGYFTQITHDGVLDVCILHNSGTVECQSMPYTGEDTMSDLLSYIEEFVGVDCLSINMGDYGVIRLLLKPFEFKRIQGIGVITHDDELPYIRFRKKC